MASPRITNESKATKNQNHERFTLTQALPVTLVPSPISPGTNTSPVSNILTPSTVKTSPEELQIAQLQLQADADYKRTCRDEYARYTSHLWEQRRDSQSQTDNLVLTLATAFLALSTSMLKSVVPINHLVGLWLLYGSWFGFGSAIIGTLFSYFLSKKSLDEHLDKCHAYFFDGDSNAFEEVTDNKNKTETCNKVSGMAFVIGLTFTLVFVGTNIQTEKNRMTQKIKTVSMIEKHVPLSGKAPFGTTPPKAPALPLKPSAITAPSGSQIKSSPQTSKGDKNE